MKIIHNQKKVSTKFFDKKIIDIDLKLNLIFSPNYKEYKNQTIVYYLKILKLIHLIQMEITLIKLR